MPAKDPALEHIELRLVHLKDQRKQVQDRYDSEVALHRSALEEIDAELAAWEALLADAKPATAKKAAAPKK